MTFVAWKPVHEILPEEWRRTQLALRLGSTVVLAHRKGGEEHDWNRVTTLKVHRGKRMARTLSYSAEWLEVDAIRIEWGRA